MADKTRLRSLAAILASLVCLFGLALFLGLANVAPLNDRGGQLAGYYLMTGLSATGYYIVLSMISSNVVGFTKKTTTGSIFFVFMGVAYFVGPQVFRDAPYYYNTRWLSVGLWIFAVLLLFGFWFLNARENKLRDKLVEEQGIDARKAGVEFLDLTDKENKLFRYVI